MLRSNRSRAYLDDLSYSLRADPPECLYQENGTVQAYFIEKTSTQLLYRGLKLIWPNAYLIFYFFVL